MSLEVQIGSVYDVVEPNVNELIDLGYTHARVYTAGSINGTYTLSTSIALVADTLAYSYNNTSGLATDWAQHAFYGAVPGETARSIPTPVGQPRATKTLIRQGVGRRLQLMDGPFAFTVTDADTLVCASLIDPDGNAEDEAGKFLRVGTQSRRARAADASPAGFVPSTGTFNVGRAYSPTLDAGSGLEVWTPRNRKDPSVIVEEAMDRARTFLWVEDILYLATSAQRTEYTLPRTIRNKRQVKKVEMSLHSFPDEPVWVRLEWALAMEQGVPILSLGRQGRAYQANRLIRVTANNVPDMLYAETDYWNVELAWAVAEVALETAMVMGAPTTQIEDLRNWSGLKKDLRESAGGFRAWYWPPVEVAMAGPR